MPVVVNKNSPTGANQIVDSAIFGTSEKLLLIPNTNNKNRVLINSETTGTGDAAKTSVVLNPKPQLVEEAGVGWTAPATGPTAGLETGTSGQGASHIAKIFNALKEQSPTAGVDITEYLSYFRPTISKYTWIQFEMVYGGLVVLPPKDSYDVQDFETRVERNSSKYHVLGVAPTLTRYSSNDTTVTITFRANSAFWDFLMNLMQDEIGVTVNCYFVTYDASAPKKGVRAGFVKGMELGAYDFLKVGAVDEFQTSSYTFSAAEARTVVFPSMY